MKVKGLTNFYDSRDHRLQSILNCVQCGKCTGVCTASNIYKLAKDEGREVGMVYNPRRILALLNGYAGVRYTGRPLSETKDLREQLFEISECVQCGLCEFYCPKSNSPRDVIKCFQELNGDEGTLHTFKEDLMKHGSITDYTILQIFPLSDSQKGRDVSEGAVQELNELINNTEPFYLEAPREMERQRKNGNNRDISKVYLFQSCCGSTLYRGMELGARYILEQLGIKVISSNEQTCCGGVPFAVNALTFIEKGLIGTRNLAVIEEVLSNCNARIIIGTCPSCVLSCREAKNLMSNEQNKKTINDRLSTIGRHIESNPSIDHIVGLLHDNIDHIKEEVKLPLNGLKVAIHSGCHARQVVREKINHKLHDLVEATGATVVDYPIEPWCCGSGPKIYRDSLAGNKNVGILYTVPGSSWYDFWGGTPWLYTNRANLFGLGLRQLRFVSGSLRQTTEKFRHMVRAGANVIVVDCPGCEMTFDKHQGIISKKFGKNYGLPTSHITELLAIAMGYDHKEIFKAQYHSVPIEPILELLS